MKQLDLNKRLPPELTIESIDDILYRIGLCLTSVRDGPKRKLFDHPFMVFGFSLLFTIERLFTTFLEDDNDLSLLRAAGNIDDI